jgi:uncharacterized membrane protein (UPF0127 family)
MRSVASPMISWLKKLKPGTPAAEPVLFRARNITRGVTLAEEGMVADTSAARRTGLLGRSEFASGNALWIVPCECIHTFGMKFAIDAVFLSRKRTVVKIVPGLRMRRIALAWAHSVIELPAGTIASTNTRIGDQLVLERRV